MRNQHIFLTATASLLLITACSSDDAGSSDSATVGSVAETTADAPSTDAPASDGAFVGAALVNITNSRFDPTEVEIEVGESVSFRNNDGFNHTITSKDDSPFAYDSGNLGESATYVQAYGEPGTFNFFCQIHPTMRGTVTVNPTD